MTVPVVIPKPLYFPVDSLLPNEREICCMIADLDRFPAQTVEYLRDGKHRQHQDLVGVIVQIWQVAETMHSFLEEGFIQSAEIDKMWREYEVKKQQFEDELREKHIYVGVDKPPTAYSIFATGVDEAIKGKLLATGLDGGQVILGAGMPGAGKSQAALVYLEGALNPSPTLNRLGETKRAGIVFHTDLDGTKLPQILAAVFPNPLSADAEILKNEFDETPASIGKVRLVVPWFLFAEYEERLAKYIKAGLEVRLLHLPLRQIGLKALELLIGAEGDDPQYVQFILDQALELGDRLTIPGLQERIETSTVLTTSQKAKALQRLRLLQAICEPPKEFAGMGMLSQEHRGVSPDLWELVTPGSTTIFMLSGQRIGSDALPLTAMLMSALMQVSPKHGPFQRIFVLDEINNLDGQKTPWGPIIRLARQIRHQGSCLLLLGQDFLEIPKSVFGLANMFWLFRPGSPQIAKHIRENVAGFEDLRFEEVSQLPAGVGLVSVRGSIRLVPAPYPTEPEPDEEPYYQDEELFFEPPPPPPPPPPIVVHNAFGPKALLARFRPPRPEHGGHTKTGF